METNSNMSQVVIETINTIFSNLFKSIDTNLFKILDNLTFIDSSILNDKYFGRIFGTSANNGILLIANSLLIGYVLYYSAKYLTSNFTFSKIENPVQFIFKLIIFGIAMNGSYFIIGQILDINFSVSNAIKSLGEDLFNQSISFSKLIESINTNLQITEESLNVFSVEGRTFPVQIEYDEKSSVSQAVLNELYKKPDASGINKGAILVFLPGLREIRQVKEELELSGACDCADILILHSSVPFAEQKKVLSVPKNNDRRRVILSSAIAETSVTVPDVTVVIDCGFMRFNSFNRTAGMPALVTQRESLFNAAQRTGRAGRIQEGKCVRLWKKDDVLSLSNPPEILRTDLTALVLECAEWGALLPESLSWLDSPPTNAWQTAKSLLKDLNCLDENSITPLGKAALLMGCHPRLACVALSGEVFHDLDLSTELASKYDKSVNGNAELVKKSTLELKKRVQKCREIYSFSSCFPQKFSGFSTACALLCGFPDRIALLEDDATGLYHFPSGRMALLPKEALRPYPKFIIAPEADAGEKTGRIYSFEAIPDKTAEEYLAAKAKVYTLVEFEKGGQKLRKTEYTSYGKLILKERTLNLAPGDYEEAVINQVKKEGIEWLPVGKAGKNLLLRVQFYLENSASDGDSLHQKFDSLAENADEWLRPFLAGVEKSVPEQKVYDALYWYLDGDRVNSSVPQEIRLPNGKRLKIQYEVQNGKIIPLAEIIIQQIFGCFETPRVMGLPVLLKLLSPARRPLQITSDLENFWKETWPQICSEMKGRYPKHNWDYRFVSD